MSSESMHCPPHPCRCAVGVHCPAHPCTCSFCKKHGHEAMECRWRIEHRHYKSLQSTKEKRREYLRLWRKVKNDNTLKKAPDYLNLAARKRIDTSCLRCPRCRVALRELSKERNLFNPLTVLNLGNEFHDDRYGRSRCFQTSGDPLQVRADGLVPTLGKGCLGLFVPSVGSYLTVEQLLCLHGLSPQKNKICYELAKDQKDADMERMLSNSMTVSVIGPVFMVTLGMLWP